MIRRVLLDLDCVLADFIAGAAAAHGLTADAVRAAWTPGEYGADKPFGLAAGLGRAMTPAEFWRPINNLPGFWRSLPKLPWADEVFHLCRAAAGGKPAGGGTAELMHGQTDDYLGGLFIVTSPSRCPGCIREKEEWLGEHFGLPFHRMIPTPHKELMAKPGVVLVDDYFKHCYEFAREGGESIMFPVLHNALFSHADDPVPVVRRLLAACTA